MSDKIDRYTRLLLTIAGYKALPRTERMLKINAYLEHLAILLDKMAEKIRRIGISPQEVEKVLERARLYQANILKAVRLARRLPDVCKEAILEILLLLYELSPDETVTAELLNIIEESDDEDFLALIADRAYEVGLFDISYEALNKLYTQGVRRYEVVYNLALVSYMMGRCEEADKLLREALKIFRKSTIMHLLGAVSIARGEFELARELFSKHL